MSLLVPMHAGQDEVTARIFISGNLFWHFLYVADGGELGRSGTSSGFHDFPLGVPEKLHLDVNTWHIVVDNPHPSPVDFRIEIQWIQAGEQLATWPPDGPREGTLKASESGVHDDSSFLAITPEAI
jgi:hypothetical protein